MATTPHAAPAAGTEQRRHTRLRVGTLAAVAVLMSCATFASPADAATNRLIVTVLSPAGDRVPDVLVTSGESTNPGFSGTTDADGRVVFADLDATSGGVCATLRQDQPLGGTAGWYQACHGFEINGITRVTLRFTPGAAISGDVTDARTGAAVTGASTVSLFVEGTLLTTPTDGSGHYVYRNLEPGLLTVLGAQAPAATAAPYGYAADTPESHITTPVALQAGGVRTDLDFRLTPNVRWSGAVVDGAGARVPNALVAVGRGADDNRAADFTTVTATANGAYTVVRPWAGGEQLCAWSRASTAHPTGLAATCTGVATPGLKIVRTITLTAVGGALVGTVVRSDGGARPGRDVAVSALVGGLAGLPLPGVIATDGTYRIEGVPTGSTRVRAVSTAGGTAYSKPTSVPAGGTTTVPQIVLSPAS